MDWVMPAMLWATPTVMVFMTIATTARVTPTQLSEIEKLELDLKDAILREDYEHAAVVRDKLKKLKP